VPCRTTQLMLGHGCRLSVALPAQMPIKGAFADLHDRSLWRKRRSDMCRIRQLALSGMIEPRWISIRNPCHNMIVESRESNCMTLRVYHDL
jgi:hypothetical protein